MAEIHVLIFLFLVAVASSTVIPAQAELVLFALLAAGEYRAWALLAAACAGGLTGTGINWVLGRYITRFRHKKWFPIKHKYLHKAEKLFAEHGKITLLLAGVPVIGDPITLAAGILKINFWFFLLLAGTSKSMRYVLVWALYEGVF